MGSKFEPNSTMGCTGSMMRTRPKRFRGRRRRLGARSNTLQIDPSEKEGGLGQSTQNLEPIIVRKRTLGHSIQRSQTKPPTYQSQFYDLGSWTGVRTITVTSAAELNG